MEWLNSWLQFDCKANKSRIYGEAIRDFIAAHTQKVECDYKKEFNDLLERMQTVCEKHKCMGGHNRLDFLDETMTAQAAEIARLREALGFYANEENWIPRYVRHSQGSYSTEIPLAAQDAGDTAIKALVTGKEGERCHADRDGECNDARCPQLRDGEPHKSGRHCPLDKREHYEEP